MNTAHDHYFCGHCDKDTQFIYILSKWVCQKCKAYAYREVKDKERKDEKRTEI